MKKALLLAALGAGALFAACSSDNGGNNCTKKTCADYSATCGSPSDNCGGTLSCGTCSGGNVCGDGTNNSVQYICGFPQPAGTVPVNFKVDDSTNHLYTSGQLDWKGSFGGVTSSVTFDGGTRIISNDQSWAGGNGPYPQLYDDGPWNKGGHEPADATAGDHVFGVTVFAKPPTTGTDSYGFGLQDAFYRANWTTIAGAGETPDGWMWVGDNGSFSVAAGQTAAVNAGTTTLRTGGNIDLQFTIDTNNLGTGTWDTSKIQIKSAAWYWGTVTLHDDGSSYGDAAAGDGIYTFTLSSVVPTPFVHTAFAKSTDKIEFVFVLNGQEYKDGGGNGLIDGVTSGYRTGTTGSFTDVTPTIATNKNTQIVVP